jgi:hypothetical protein
MADIPAFIAPPKKSSFFSRKPTNVPTPEPLSQTPVTFQTTTNAPAPTEQTPVPPAPVPPPKKPGFFSRITAPVKNLFSPKPTPAPQTPFNITPLPMPPVNDYSNLDFPVTDNGTIPLEYNPNTNMYEPKPVTLAPAAVVLQPTQPLAIEEAKLSSSSSPY